MRADYEKLRSLWAKAAVQAADLDVINRALVYNYLGYAAAHTAEVLRTHGNDPSAAKDAEKYAKGIRSQDPLRKGFGWAELIAPIFGFGSVGGVLVGGALGLFSLFDQARQAGAQVDLRPLVIKLLTSTAVLLLLLRTAARVGPHVGKAIGDAWSAMLRSTDPAQRVIASNLDASESVFYAGLSVPRPSRLRVNAAGPVVAIVGMAIFGLPFALAFFYLFASFSASAQRPPTFRGF